MLRTPIAAAVIALIALAAGGAAAQQAAPKETVKVKHGDWEVRCGANDNCYMNQIVLDEGGAPLINVAISQLKNNPQADAVLQITAPLGVVLPRGIEMRIDGGKPITLPFAYCLSNCVSSVPMTEEGLALLRRGAAATVKIYSVQKQNEAIERKLSLSGFTKAYGAL